MLPGLQCRIQRAQKRKKNMNDQYKSGFAALIGRPNVGKSTLMNNLIGQKIAITSRKPQTTRNRIRTVYTSDEGQIVFTDTPGIHKSKNKLGEYMVGTAESAIREVDVILFLVEPTDYIGAGEKHIIEQLSKQNTPVILVINKDRYGEERRAAALYRCVPEGNEFCRDRSGFCPEKGKYRGADLLYYEISALWTCLL